MNRKHVDLLIMGTKCASDEEETLFGSNTLIVMEYLTECPILAIPGGHRIVGRNKIDFPTDYETAFDQERLKYMLVITKSHNSEIKILHSKKERYLEATPERNKALLDSVFKGLQCSFHLLDNMRIHKGIQSFVEDENCDAIVFVDEE
ncbi:hypothetical protein [Pricia antarctica]|nr:hypothetical protein [Pricia antarctica]